MSHKSHDTKRSIVAFLETNGPSKLDEVAMALGEGWRHGNLNARLRKYVAQMVRAGLLKKVPGRGVYALANNYHLRGLDRQDATEQALVRFLEERGGIVSRLEIREAFEDGSPYDHRKITLLLKSSRLFYQPFGRGIWALHARAHLPFIGRWAMWEIEVTARRDTWLAERSNYCRGIGDAFMRARGNLGTEEVAADPEIRAALADMADAAPGTRERALDDLRADIAIAAKATGISDLFAIAEMERQRKAIELPQHLYLHFEDGAPALHNSAPAAFYCACARLFGVSAAALSRGKVERGGVDHRLASALILAPHS